MASKGERWVERALEAAVVGVDLVPMLSFIAITLSLRGPGNAV